MNKLCKLLADNRRMPQRRFEIAAKDDGSEAEIFLYDAIVSDELEAEWFGGVAPRSPSSRRCARSRPAPSTCGSTRRAVRSSALVRSRQALREHPANIIAHIDGLAASAATFVAMAADRVVMNKGALFMIHKAWTFAYGNSDELVALADLLDKIDGTLVQTYADRTKQDPKTIEVDGRRNVVYRGRGGGQWFRRQHCRRTRPRRKRHGTSAPTARRPPRTSCPTTPNSRPSMRQLCCAASTSLH